MAEAAASLERALDIKPDYAEACCNLANVLSRVSEKESLAQRREGAEKALGGLASLREADSVRPKERAVRVAVEGDTDSAGVY